MIGSMVSLLLSGGAGGLVRGIVGFLKYQFAYKDVKFQPGYIAIIMALSGFVGLVVTWAIVASGLKLPFLDQINPALAFIVGYAGGDLIENLYKILAGKTTLYPLPET